MTAAARLVLGADELARSVARAKVRENVERLTRRADASLAAVYRELEAARLRLLGQLASGSGEFGAGEASAMLRAIEAEMQRLRTSIRAPLALGYRESLTSGDADMASQGAAVLGDGEAWRVQRGVSSMLIDAANGRSADLVGEISETARARLNEIVRRSAVGSSRVADVGREIGAVLDAAGRPQGVFGTLALQVERVVRTETHAMYETAAQARARQIAESSPWVMQSVWVTVRDDRTRESHARMNGATVVIGESFNFGASDPWHLTSYEQAEREGGELGLAVTGPHDSILPASEAVNCRCTRVLRRGERKR